MVLGRDCRRHHANAPDPGKLARNQITSGMSTRSTNAASTFAHVADLPGHSADISAPVRRAGAAGAGPVGLGLRSAKVDVLV